MANRVLIGSLNNDYVLRVSRPGFNALDPNLPYGAVAFDSRWSETVRLVYSGEIVINMGQDRTERTITAATFPDYGRPLFLRTITVHREGNGHISNVRATRTALIYNRYVHVSLNMHMRWYLFDMDFLT